MICLNGMFYFIYYTTHYVKEVYFIFSFFQMLTKVKCVISALQVTPN